MIPASGCWLKVILIQVLARFEDFPTKKLEALRMAAALHTKLDSIAKTLQNWPIVPPVGQLLEKAESYFNKVETKFAVDNLSIFIFPLVALTNGYII